MSAYSQEFRDAARAGVIASAQAMIPVIYNALKPTSVVDVGCGEGWFLKEFGAFGVKELCGIDEEILDPLNGDIDYYAFDLNYTLPIRSHFDLALCLETAEHLAPESADTLVDSLCALSDKILFSAAIPAQGGIHHVNEQWQSYWVEKFWERGYHVSDKFRWEFWDNPDIETWYAQNLLFFFKGDEFVDASSYKVKGHFDVVHPRLWGYYRGLGNK